MTDCTEILQEMYAEIEVDARKMVRNIAFKYYGTIRSLEYDDMVQECSEAILSSLPRFEGSKVGRGGLDSFLYLCVRNAIFSKSRADSTVGKFATTDRFIAHPAKRRDRHAVSLDAFDLPVVGEGNENYVAARWSFDGGSKKWNGVILPGSDDGDYDVNEQEELDIALESVRANLDFRQVFVLDALLDPPEELMEIHEALCGNINDPPSQIAIVEWLDPLFSKFQMDRIMAKIRRVIMEHADNEHFSVGFRASLLQGWTRLGVKKRKKTG